MPSWGSSGICRQGTPTARPRRQREVSSQAAVNTFAFSMVSVETIKGAWLHTKLLPIFAGIGGGLVEMSALHSAEVVIRLLMETAMKIVLGGQTLV